MKEKIRQFVKDYQAEILVTAMLVNTAICIGVGKAMHDSFNYDRADFRELADGGSQILVFSKNDSMAMVFTKPPDTGS